MTFLAARIAVLQSPVLFTITIDFHNLPLYLNRLTVLLLQFPFNMFNLHVIRVKFRTARRVKMSNFVVLVLDY